MIGFSHAKLKGGSPLPEAPGRRRSEARRQLCHHHDDADQPVHQQRSPPVLMRSHAALHYAHFFYGDSDASGGVTRPASRAAPSPTTRTFSTSPSSIGMTFHRLRRIAFAHGVLAFFFDVVVLALIINVVAGLL
jgi:hypothetical protein